MRRENRIKKLNNKTTTDKIILYTCIGIAILAMIVFALFMYSKSLSDEVKDSTMSLEQMSKIAGNSTQNDTQNTQSASTEIGKSVEESKNETNTSNSTTNVTNKTNTVNATNSNNTTNTTTNKTANNTSSVATDAKTTEQEEKKELSFQKPVEGEIVREYAKDNLIYSETLDEWTTHMGIDIKAEKTSVVNAAEAGTVKTIKNDPRYGLTIVIEHGDGFETVYSNLLTSEFVVEGEQVEKGQAIGTVGNTAAFEIADEPHLHFEIWKDSLPVDPEIYLN